MRKFTAKHQPLPLKVSPLRALACKSNPILLNCANHEFRLSISDAEQLVKQLNEAINRDILGRLNQRVTKSGEVLQFHNVNGFSYFTCPNQ